jgi:hypothetical protein
MNAYAEDLRKKIVEALERGMPKIEAARTFGVGISSVKRYMATYREGRSLVPKKRPGFKPKLECESARKLLEANLKEHPEATPCPRGVSSLAAGCAGWRSATPPFPGSSSAWASVEKRSVGASERDEFLRAAWRLMVAEGIPTPSSSWCSWTSAPPTPRWHPCVGLVA